MGVAGTTAERVDAASNRPHSPVMPKACLRHDGSRPTGARFVAKLDRSPAALFASLLPDRHAAPRSDVPSFGDSGY